MSNENEIQVQVIVDGETRLYSKGTTYQEIAKEYQSRFDNQIVLVTVDQFRLQELNREVEDGVEVGFITIGDTIGYETYRRSLCFLMVKAVHDVGGHDTVERVQIHFSISDGYYCEVSGIELNEEFIEKVKERMIQLSSESIPINKRSVSTSKAIEMFRKHRMYDKERLFEYRRVSSVNIYSINEFEDYYYGYMVPDTSYLKWFDLYLYDQGFVLQMPTKGDPEHVCHKHIRNKLFSVLKDAVEWGKMQNIETVGDLNDKITGQSISETLLVQEAYQESKIAEIAQEIANRKNVKFVLIAGPSSSGKTTFSHRLSIQLRVNGMIPHPIAVDNYFVDRENTPRNEDGSYNFECLGAIDIEQFNKDMLALMAGDEVYLPIFDFKKGKRSYSTVPKKLGPNDVLVIEGIHCLNPKLTEMMNNDNKFKIYISALTQLNIDEHNRIPTTDGRLIRRIVRDARTRGTSAEATIAMWNSVRRGEEQNIFPFQEEADVMFNSSMLYELAVLKQYIEPQLFSVGKETEEYAEAKRLLKFFDYFVGIGAESVPTNSILREFIGGGCFNV